jgi:hypothetical protein
MYFWAMGISTLACLQGLKLGVGWQNLSLAHLSILTFLPMPQIERYNED